MKLSTSPLLFVALFMGFGGFAGCNGGDPPVKPPVKPNVPPRAEGGEIKPRFTIDCGLMDVWDKKKTGPIFMSVSPDGKFLMTMSQSSKENLQVWDLGTKTKVHGIRNDIGTMYAPIAIAADSKTAAYVQLRPKGAIILFDLVTGRRIQTMPGDWLIDSFVRGLHFSPDGSLIVLGCKQEIVFWDTATGKQKFTWKEPSTVRALSPFFENGSKIACLNGAGRIDI
jgi:WD40 repeat protein